MNILEFNRYLQGKYTRAIQERQVFRFYEVDPDFDEILDAVDLREPILLRETGGWKHE